MAMWRPPTRDGLSSGRDRVTGLAWAFEQPIVHWNEHDERQVAYWRSRPAEERLAQAAAYRVRVHGHCAEPHVWTWKFVPFGAE